MAPRTTAKTEICVSPNDLIDQVIETQRILQQEDDLSPRNPRITKALTAFVQNIIAAEQSFTEAEKQEVLDNHLVKTVRPGLLNGLSRAEYEMELYFSDLFLNDPNFTEDSLNDFWYLQNYIDLVDLELETITLPADENKEVVFIGSGPLPLTAIIMAQKTGMHMTCLDLDEYAIIRGHELTKKLGISDKIQYKQSAGHEYDYKNTALVMIASLVGNKEEVLNTIQNTADEPPQVAIRSAEGLHALLYEPVTTSILDVFNMCVQKQTRQEPRVINTTLMCGFKQNFR